MQLVLKKVNSKTIINSIFFVIADLLPKDEPFLEGKTLAVKN